MRKSQLRFERLEDRLNPAPPVYTWNYTGAGVGNASVAANWVGNEVPPNGSIIKLPAGTGNFNEDSVLVTIQQLIVEPGWEKGFTTEDGVKVYDVDVQSGSFVPLDGVLEFLDGVFKPAAGKSVGFSTAFGGEVKFSPNSTLTFDGTAANANFFNQGKMVFSEGTSIGGKAVFKGAKWSGVAGGPDDSIEISRTLVEIADGNSQALGQVSVTVSGTASQLKVGDTRKFETDGWVQLGNRALAVVGKGSELKITGSKAYNVAPFNTTASLIVDGDEAKVSMYGNEALLNASHAAIFHSTSWVDEFGVHEGGLFLFQSGAGMTASRYTNKVSGSMSFSESTVRFVDTDAQGVLDCSSSIDLLVSALAVRADYAGNAVRDRVTCTDLFLDGAAVTVQFLGVRTGANQWLFAAGTNSLTGTFAFDPPAGSGATITKTGNSYFLNTPAP